MTGYDLVPVSTDPDLAWQVEDLFAQNLGMRNQYGDYRGENKAKIAVVARDTQEVVGGLVDGWHQEREGPNVINVYKADIVMDANHRGPGMPGLQLARMPVAIYQKEKATHGPYAMMRLRVTNRKLADWLERQFQWHDSYDQAGGEERTLIMY
jgi:hypothetical protein